MIIGNLDLQFLARALGGEVEGNQIRAPGPGHSAKDRSLSVKLDANAPDGFMVHSFAGDDAIVCKDYVREKTGLSVFKPQRRRRASTDTINAMLAGAMQSLKTEAPTGRIVAAYDYTDDKGELLYQVVRLEPKDFRQRRPDGKGGWTWSAGERRVLYRLPELVQFPDASVFVTEGEKDADRVASLGLCATTVACGKWTPDCVNALAGRDVLVLEDNDEAGRKKALEAATALHGTAKSIRIVRLPDLPEKGDVSDWLDADLRNGKKLADVCFEAPVWAPETKPSSWCFHSDTEAAPTPWLIKNILPKTGAGLISGQWGSYKTTLALDIAVSVMTGAPFASRYPVKRQGAVAYFAAEGSAGLTSRLTAIARECGITGALPFAYRSDCPALTADDAAGKIVAAVKEVGAHYNAEVTVVFVDTVISAAGYAKTGDDNDTAAAQRVMSTLTAASKGAGALVLGLDHFGKVTETGTRGSSAKEGNADVVLALLADRELSGTVANTRLAIRKQRDGAAGMEIPFTPKTIEVGTDPDGDAITRVVIDWATSPPQAEDKRWVKSLQLLRRVLMAILADAGEEVCPFADGPVVRACDLSLVRAEFDKQYIAEGTDRQKADARRKAFQRAVKDAQAKELVATREMNGRQLAWLVNPIGGTS